MNDLDLIPFRLLLDRVVVPARRYLPRTLLGAAVPMAMTSVIMALAQARWSKVALNPNPEDLGALFGGCFVFLGIALCTMFIFVLTFGALTVASMDAVAGREVRMGRAWAFVLRPSVCLTLMLTSFLNFLSILLFLFPALYVVPLLSYTVPVMVEEKRVGLNAISRSIELVRFNPTGRLTHSPWLQTLVVLIVGTLLSYIVSLMVQMPFVIVQQILMFRETVSNPEAALEMMGSLIWLQLPASVLGALATSITWLYTTFGICVLHRELSRRREARDLVEAVDRLTGQV